MGLRLKTNVGILLVSVAVSASAAMTHVASDDNSEWYVDTAQIQTLPDGTRQAVVYMKFHQLQQAANFSYDTTQGTFEVSCPNKEWRLVSSQALNNNEVIFSKENNGPWRPVKAGADQNVYDSVCSNGYQAAESTPPDASSPDSGGGNSTTRESSNFSFLGVVLNEAVNSYFPKCRPSFSGSDPVEGMCYEVDDDGDFNFSNDPDLGFEYGLYASVDDSGAVYKIVFYARVEQFNGQENWKLVKDMFTQKYGSSFSTRFVPDSQNGDYFLNETLTWVKGGTQIILDHNNETNELQPEAVIIDIARAHANKAKRDAAARQEHQNTVKRGVGNL